MSRRVCVKDVSQAGSLGEFITQLVENVGTGNLDQKERSAMVIRSLTEQPAGLDGIQDADNIILLARSNAIKALVACVVTGGPISLIKLCKPCKV